MKNLFYLLPMLLFNFFATAQQKTITGTVTSQQNKTPLPGVTVQAGSNHAITNGSGQFSISASPGDVLSFSYIGMKSFTQKVEDNTAVLSIQMEENATDLNQIIVTGYQTQKKADLTGAVAVVNVNEIKNIPLGNPVKAL